MNVDNSCGIQCTSLSLLDSAVDNVVQVLLNNEEEVSLIFYFIFFFQFEARHDLKLSALWF